MKEFANLLNELYFTHSNLNKLVLLKQYFNQVKDPTRGYALSIIAGTQKFKLLKRGLLKELIQQKIDPYLSDLSYHYVGDLSDTISLLWPEKKTTPKETLPSLDSVINTFQTSNKEQVLNYLNFLLDNMDANERWALLKIITGSLRIGVSARFVKQALAEYGDKTIHEIEEVWHATTPPYENLFAWLEGHGEKIHLQDKAFFHPVMLSHPFDEAHLTHILPEDFFVEWKYDGIRVQLVITPTEKALYSRTGDDITQSFADVIQHDLSPIVLDGELVIKNQEGVGTFNELQKRLNKKNPTSKFMHANPAHIILYDILSLQGEDLRHLTLSARRTILESWFADTQPQFMSLSKLLDFTTQDQLIELRKSVLASSQPAIEGLMLKRKLSPYISGRPSHQWYKWKRDPLLIDAVLMYAQLGHGKRSSFYSDYTFGLWHEDKLLPIGKAYFGFTDEELKQLDKWIRTHTVNKFGPVREVEKGLVFEVAFDAVQVSPRHKSGYALRFPRINRIRWDKPAGEADIIDSLKNLLG